MIASGKSKKSLFFVYDKTRHFSLTELGFSRKQFNPPVEDIDFFEVDSPWISSQIYRDPQEFSIFFALAPLEFQRLLLYH